MDLTGKAFGRLTVLRRVKAKRISWQCKCSCGTEKSVAQKELLNGDTKSCGCLHRERLRARNLKHGGAYRGSASRTYKKWLQMWSRVRNPSGKNKCYESVTICKEWGEFENFLRDMGVPPIGYSLERRRNSEGYKPDNCKWIPLKEQARNKTTNIYVKFNGVETHVSEHARKLNLDPNLVFDRINKLGWTIEQALSKSPRPLKRK